VGGGHGALTAAEAEEAAPVPSAISSAIAILLDMIVLHSFSRSEHNAPSIAESLRLAMQQRKYRLASDSIALAYLAPNRQGTTRR